MSKKHPIVAVTGSSGAGTTTVKRAFEHIFFRDGVKPAVIEGDSFHSLNRMEFREAVKKAEAQGNRYFSHFGPEANDFAALEKLFRAYGDTGMGQRRYYLHSQEEADHHNGRLGTKLGPASSPPGRTSRPAPTCCSTKACTAWSSPSRTTSPGTSTSASPWCPS